jgi:Cell wall-associated hydrolases (invasion-associated proteins)
MATFDYPFVPLIRPLHMGLKGRDVTAVQLALRQAGIRHHDPTGRFGAATKHQVGEFKKHHNIDENGYASHTHKNLWKYFGPIAHNMYRNLYNEKRHFNTVEKVCSAAMYGYDNRAVIHYTQDSRRMQDFAPPPNVPNYTDCSGFVTWCYKSGGASDPNGFGYAGYGFTGTLLQHGQQVPLGSIKPADLVFYGHPVSHVAIAVSDSRVVSHGKEEGPELVAEYYWSAINCARRYISQ